MSARAGRAEIEGLSGEIWTWLVQRVTAALLLVFLGTHFWVLHFALADESITFSSVTARLQTPFFAVVDSALLAIVLFHGLNGLRAVLLDFDFAQRIERALTWILIFVGVVTLAFGLFALVPFISGQPRY
ncbi:MAG: hypothetical protein M1370_05090 [Bacteroidetes bacterium]|nr:hypothetical protein [Bacteroidota bacterium]